MKTTFIHELPRWKSFVNAIGSWMMVLLTLAFIALYGLALFGGFKHLVDDRMISHMEPVIFVVIGYSFGRLPSRQNEKSLKQEICRQARKTEAAQQAKEQIQQAREALEEKIKNVRVILMSWAIKASSATGRPPRSSASPSDHPGANPGGVAVAGGEIPPEPLRLAVDIAINILDS